MASPGQDGYTVNIYGVTTAITSGLEALDGMFFAATRGVLREISFDESTFDGFHGYDIDFTLRAQRAGFRVGTCAEIALIHASAGGFDAGWARYAEKFAAKHRSLLAGRAGARSWPVAAIKVATREEIARAFPLERLKAVTVQLRAQSAGGGTS
jgi:GT2 family glycosyltransferase